MRRGPWRIRRVNIDKSIFGEDADMLDHAENIRHFEVMKDPLRKDVFEETRKLGQCWKSRLRITCLISEIVIKFDSMKNDGS